jgi:hypothetical protein
MDPLQRTVQRRAIVHVALGDLGAGSRQRLGSRAVSIAGQDTHVPALRQQMVGGRAALLAGRAGDYDDLVSVARGKLLSFSLCQFLAQASQGYLFLGSEDAHFFDDRTNVFREDALDQRLPGLGQRHGNDVTDLRKAVAGRKLWSAWNTNDPER